MRERIASIIVSRMMRLAMRLAHVLDGAAHDLGFLVVTRVPVAAGNERPAVKFLHGCLLSSEEPVELRH